MKRPQVPNDSETKIMLRNFENQREEHWERR